MTAAVTRFRLAAARHGLRLYRPLQIHRARQGAGLERLVRRTEDRADAEPAAFPHLPALSPRLRHRPRLSRALDGIEARGHDLAGIPVAMGLLRLDALY